MSGSPGRDYTKSDSELLTLSSVMSNARLGKIARFDWLLSRQVNQEMSRDAVSINSIL